MEAVKGKYKILGTLGDEEGYLTCSMHIAKKMDNADQIKPYPHFEEAAEALRSGNISCLLVPGAYPRINHFIMDAELKVSETFIEKIPSLILCGVQDSCPEQVKKIYHHPATTYLLSEINTVYIENVPVSSNPEACRMTLQSPNESIAISNQLCANFYGLTTYEVLRDGIDMPWVCFTKSEGVKV